jgi:hypothetical protein
MKYGISLFLLVFSLLFALEVKGKEKHRIAYDFERFNGKTKKIKAGRYIEIFLEHKEYELKHFVAGKLKEVTDSSIIIIAKEDYLETSSNNTSYLEKTFYENDSILSILKADIQYISYLPHSFTASIYASSASILTGLIIAPLISIDWTDRNNFHAIRYRNTVNYSLIGIVVGMSTIVITRPSKRNKLKVPS